MTIQLDSKRQADLLTRCWVSQWTAMIVVGCDSGRVLEANPAAEQLTGYGRDELLQLPVVQLHPENEREEVRKALRVMTGSPVTRRDLHLLGKDGAIRPLEILATEAFPSDEGPVVVVSLRDITEQVRNEHRLSVQNWALQAYSSAALALGRARSAKALMDTVCEAITRDSPYVLCWIGLTEEGPGKPVRMAAWAGPASDYLGGLKVSWDETQPTGKGPTGTCIRTGEPQIMQDSQTVPTFAPWRERAERVGIRSSAAVAFLGVEQQRGALMVYAAHPYAFEPEAMEVFQRLAEEVGHALRALDKEHRFEAERVARAEAQSRLAQTLIATVQALASTVEKRDPYTAGHQERVSQIACAIGGELAWDEHRLKGLRLAALVHDIGKVAIPIEVLTKPSRLNAIERAMVNEHPENGYAILKDIPFPWPVADIVRQHHERMDGTGYPLGLAGDAILPEARVLSVADILESMASFRPYRPALGLDVALQEIEHLSGAWLDPAVVAACVTLFREKHFPLPIPHRG